MKSESKVTKLDCVNWTSDVRDQINKEIADMSGEEIQEWLSHRPTDRVVATLFDRMKAPNRGGDEVRT